MGWGEKEGGDKNVRIAKPRVPSTKLTKVPKMPRTVLMASWITDQMLTRMPLKTSRMEPRRCSMPENTPILVVVLLLVVIVVVVLRYQVQVQVQVAVCVVSLSGEIARGVTKVNKRMGIQIG